MTLDLSGQVAFVSGSAKRLGRVLAERLAQRGARVFVHCHRSREEAEAVVAGIRERGGQAEVLQADLLDETAPAAIAKAIKASTGRLDILVNNVGNYIVKPVEESTVDDWRDTLNANLIAPFALVKECLSLFPDRGGNIINIGYAGVDLIRPNVQATAYQASKTGLLVLTKSLAERFGPRALRVNMISPGQLENSVDLPAADEIADAIPLARAGRVTEIADAMDYLLAADYVTGINLDVAGGYRPPVK